VPVIITSIYWIILEIEFIPHFGVASDDILKTQLETAKNGLFSLINALTTIRKLFSEKTIQNSLSRV
jgi:hypothetical protein